MRIAYFIHGRNTGHTFGSLPVIETLCEKGHTVQVFGPPLARQFFPNIFTMIPTITLTPKNLLRLPSVLFSNIARIRSRFDCVISDGDLPGLIAARMAGIPCIATGHGLVFSSCILPAGLPCGALCEARRTAWPHVVMASVACIPVHFLPVKPRRANTYVARIDDWRVNPSHHHVQPTACPLTPPFDVVYARQFEGSRYALALARRGRRVLLITDEPAPPTHPLVCVSPPDRNLFLSAIEAAEVVIGAAGNGVISESLLAGKPLLALYRGRAEQRLNCHLLDIARAAVCAPLGVSVEASVDRVLDAYHQQALRIPRLAQELPPLSEVVIEVLSRL